VYEDGMKAQLVLIFLLGLAGSYFAVRTQQTATIQGWQESKSNDPVDEPRRQFRLPGKFLAPLEGNPTSPPSLLLKCTPDDRSDGKGRFRVGVVVVGVPLKIHLVEIEERKTGISYYPEVSVSYRLDEGKPVNDDWPPRFDKSSVEFDKADFKKMLHTHTILITVPDKEGRPIVMQFDMPDSSAGPLPTEQVAEACGIHDLKK
jgi:hypothetical protein